jgi:hypothetical protein
MIAVRVAHRTLYWKREPFARKDALSCPRNQGTFDTPKVAASSHSAEGSLVLRAILNPGATVTL